MFRRILTLVKLQLSDQTSIRFNENWKNLLVKLVIRLSIIVVITLGISFLFRFFIGVTYIKLDEHFLGTVVTIIQITALVSCSVQLIHTLYLSRENVILLSLPVKHNEIFISKLIVFYLYELRRNLYLILPLYIGYSMRFGGYYGFGASFYLTVCLLTIVIPLLPVLIGAVISLPLVFIINYIKKHTLLHILTVLGSCFLVSIFVASSFSQVGQRLTPLEAWGEILIAVQKVTVYINEHSLIYFCLNQMVFGKNFLLNTGIVFGSIAGMLVFIWLISLPTYFKMAVFPFDDAPKKKYHVAMEVNDSTYFTFLKKELKMFFRSSDQVIGSFVYLIILPFLIYVLNDLFLHLKPNEFGEMIILGVNVLLGLVLLLASNISSATAITREGSEFYLMKIVPSSTYKIAWAKVTINITVSVVVIILTTVSLALVNIISIQNVLMIGLLFLLVNSGHILWSYELDLLKPRIVDYLSGQSIDDNPNATKSILMGLLIASLFAIITIFFMYDDYATGWIRVILIACAFLGARIYLFINRANVYFERIEI